MTWRRTDESLGRVTVDGQVGPETAKAVDEAVVDGTITAK
jgi:hypothetical protein